MEMKNLVTGVVLVTVVALAFSGFIANAAWRYGTTYDDTFLDDTFNKTDEWTQLQSDMSDTLDEGSGVQDDDQDKLGKYLGKGIETIKFAGQSFGIFTDFAEASADKLHIPEYMMKAMLVILLAGIVLGAMAAVFTGRVRA